MVILNGGGGTVNARGEKREKNQIDRHYITERRYCDENCPFVGTTPLVHRLALEGKLNTFIRGQGPPVQ